MLICQLQVQLTPPLLVNTDNYAWQPFRDTPSGYLVGLPSGSFRLATNLGCFKIASHFARIYEFISFVVVPYVVPSLAFN